MHGGSAPLSTLALSTCWARGLGLREASRPSCLDAARLSVIIASCEWDGSSTFCFPWAASCDPLSCLLCVTVIAETQQPAVFRQPYEVASLVRTHRLTLLVSPDPVAVWAQWGN